MDFLLQLAGISLGGSGAILLLLLLTRLTSKRYAARWRCWMWLLLGLRLALPLSVLPESAAPSVPIMLTAPENTVIYRSPARTQPEIPTLPAVQTAPALPSFAPAAEPDRHLVETPGFSLTLGQALFGIWLLGTAGVLLWNGIAHLRFCRYVRRWTRLVDDPPLIQEFYQLGDRLKLSHRPQLFFCAGLTVPMLAGLFRPVLLLPEDIPSKETRYCVLLHELTHYRRRDIWLKTLMIWVRALHWFNPLVWLMARTVERDTELACDEGALAWLSKEERALYGQAILQAAAAGNNRDF